jgi:hypothetical protein
MVRTLNAGEHKLVITRGINERIAGDTKFAKFVWKSLRRFNRGDWGDVSANDWQANDLDLESLNTGGWYGRILAVYSDNGFAHTYEIWIIRNTAEEDGTQAITVLFPSEY